MIDELQLAVRLEQPGVRADGVDIDAVELFRRSDEHVGHRARRQFDHEIVDCIARGAFDDVKGQDVGTYRTERHGQRAEAARSILQLDPQQIRRHAEHCRTAPAGQHSGHMARRCDRGDD